MPREKLLGRTPAELHPEVGREAGDRGVEQFGEERLRSVLSSARGADATDIAARVETSVLDFQVGHLADDLAVLVLRATGGD